MFLHFSVDSYALPVGFPRHVIDSKVAKYVINSSNLDFTNS